MVGCLRPTGANVVWVAVVENVTPVEQRARLVFISHGDLPPTEHCVPHPAACQPLCLAERQLPNGGSDESPRCAVVAQFPTGRGVELAIIKIAIALVEPGKVGAECEPLGEAPCEHNLHGLAFGFAVSAGFA